jgi:DNA-binding MarR family transcriptional regulator
MPETASEGFCRGRLRCGVPQEANRAILAAVLPGQFPRRMTTVEKYKNRGFDCVCGNLRMATRAVTRLYDEQLQPCGLRATQLSVLWAMSARGPTTVQSVARTILMDQSTLIRNLRLLERDGLVAITTGADRRERIVKLTAAGRRRFERAMPLWEKAQRKISRKLKLRSPGPVADTLLAMARAFR